MAKPAADYQNWIIGGIVLVIVVIGAILYVTKNGVVLPQMGNTTHNTTSGSSTNSNTNGSNVSSNQMVMVSDQPAGSFVVVQKVSADAVAWVAVQDADGMHTLGAARINAGESSAVQVPLLRNTEAGKKYQVVIFTDDGDKQFDLKKDTLVTGVTGTFSALNGD